MVPHSGDQAGMVYSTNISPSEITLQKADFATPLLLYLRSPLLTALWPRRFFHNICFTCDITESQDSHYGGSLAEVVFADLVGPLFLPTSKHTLSLNPGLSLGPQPDPHTPHAD